MATSNEAKVGVRVCVKAVAGTLDIYYHYAVKNNFLFRHLQRYASLDGDISMATVTSQALCALHGCLLCQTVHQWARIL